MTEWSPPEVPRSWLVVIGLAYALVLGYFLVIVHQVLLGVFVGLLLASLYVVWRFLVALEAIADAQQRLARQRQRD